MKAAALFGFLLACQGEQFLDHSEQSILGGKPTEVGDYPSVVAIVSDGGLCTGTLVSPSWVVTAAHCIDPVGLGYSSQAQVTNSLRVVFDAVDLQDAGEAYVVGAAESVKHASFTEPGDPDIGLIRLETPVNDRKPASLNFDATSVPAGSKVTMVGYGVADNGDAGREFVLQSAQTASCNNYGVSDKTFICFDQRAGKGKCSGDSGGPSFMDIGGRQTLVGVTSFGDQNCQYYGADMRVDASKEFIQKNAPELLCGSDDSCNDACGSDNLPVDPDCPICATDSECGVDSICAEGACIAAPLTSGGVGGLCGADAPACEQGVCGKGPKGESRCITACEVNDDCPSDFACLPAGDSGACWPTDDAARDDQSADSGCQASGKRPIAGAWMLAILLILYRQMRTSQKRTGLLA